MATQTTMADLYAMTKVNLEGPTKSTGAIATANSEVASSKANLNAEVQLGANSINLQSAKGDEALRVIDRMEELKKNTNEGQKFLQTQMSSIFQAQTQTLAKQQEIGFQSAIEGLQAQSEYYAEQEKKNKSWNPITKITSWYKGQEAADTAINKMGMASSAYKSAEIIQKNTTEKMQQLQTEYTMTVGAENQFKMEELRIEAEKRAAQLGIVQNTMANLQEVRGKINTAAQQYWGSKRNETADAINRAQQRRINDELKSEEGRARAWLTLRGITTPTQEQLSAAKDATKALSAQGLDALSKARTVGFSPKAILNLPVADIQAIGQLSGNGSSFGEDIFNKKATKVVEEEYDSQYKVAVREGKIKSSTTKDMWRTSEDGKKAWQFAQEVAKTTISKLRSETRGVDLIAEAGNSVSLPASLNLATALATNGGGSLSRYIPNPTIRAQVASNFAPGSAGDSMYKLTMSNIESNLDMSETGPQVQIAALMHTLIQTKAARNPTEAARMVVATLNQAAMSNAEAMSPTASLLIEAGYGSALRPKVPMKLYGRDAYNGLDEADALLAYEWAQDKMGRKITVFDTIVGAPGVFMQQEIPLVTSAGRAFVQAAGVAAERKTAAERAGEVFGAQGPVGSWLTDKAITPFAPKQNK